MLRSSIWVYFSSWFNKLAGLISTIVLARILTPDDFGIVATGAIITSIFTTLTSLGPETYLLRKDHISKDDLHTAWSIGIVLKFLVFLGMFFSAPFVASFFNDVRLVAVLQVISIFPFVASFNNIGMLLYKKAMNYKPAFKLTVMTRLITLTTKIILAIYLNNYWAFIIAELISKISLVLISYILHSFRPVFSFTNAREQWSFSKWVLAKGIFSNVRYKIDNILVTKFFSAQALGLYSTSKEIATMPAGQIVQPLIQPLYVGLAESIKVPEIFADKVHKAILAAGMLVFPLAFGISALASPIVLILLGEQWSEAIPLVEIISFLLLSGIFNSLATQIFNLLNQVRLSFYMDVFLGLGTVILFIALANQLSLDEFAILRVVIGLFSVNCMYLYLGRVSKISIGKIVMLLLPVFIMAISMYLFVNFVTRLELIEVLIGRLLISVLFGVVFYSLFSLLIVYILKQYFDEYDFLWKTFYLPLFSKLKLKLT